VVGTENGQLGWELQRSCLALPGWQPRVARTQVEALQA
jgi:hypothetical protein